MNLAANEVEVCRALYGDDYASVSRVGHDGVLEPELLAGVMLSAATVFGDDREGDLP
ncbi:MAG TPA: hypothetical protein VHY82_04500 [Acetobacteraceae bacterium]|nr:hypothetical protein [Acetobacteraceae bacterium]